MKRFFGICLIFFLVLAVNSIKLATAEEGTNNFRKTTWGMSKSQVKATESKKPKFKSDSRLGYLGKVLGMDTRIIYDFVNNKLAKGHYVFFEKHTNKTDYIKNYEKLKAILIKKYGKANEDKIYWSNELYKSDPEQWGLAVILGHLKYMSKWEDEDTEIGMVLTGDDNEINLMIEYYSKALGGVLKELIEKRMADDL